MSWGLMCRQVGAAPTWRLTGRDSEKSERRRKRGGGGGGGLRARLDLLSTTRTLLDEIHSEKNLDAADSVIIRRFTGVLLCCVAMPTVPVCSCVWLCSHRGFNASQRPIKAAPDPTKPEPGPKKRLHVFLCNSWEKTVGWTPSTCQEVHMEESMLPGQLIRDKQLHLLDRVHLYTHCKTTTGRVWSVTWGSLETFSGSEISPSCFKSRTNRDAGRGQVKTRTRTDREVSRTWTRPVTVTVPANKDKSE